MRTRINKLHVASTDGATVEYRNTSLRKERRKEPHVRVFGKLQKISVSKAIALVPLMNIEML